MGAGARHDLSVERKEVRYADECCREDFIGHVSKHNCVFSAFVIGLIIIVITIIVVVTAVLSASARRAKCTRWAEGAVGIAKEET